MFDFVELATWVAGAVIAVGLIQWAKGLAPAAPRWVWAAASPLAALAAALAAGGPRWAWNWLGVWAISQVGYELIIQRIRSGLGGAKAPGSIAQGPASSADREGPKGAQAVRPEASP